MYMRRIVIIFKWVKLGFFKVRNAGWVLAGRLPSLSQSAEMTELAPSSSNSSSSFSREIPLGKRRRRRKKRKRPFPLLSSTQSIIHEGGGRGPFCFLQKKDCLAFEGGSTTEGFSILKRAPPLWWLSFPFRITSINYFGFLFSAWGKAGKW